MNKRLHLIIYIVFILASLTASAQEDTPRQIYNQAETDYEIGRVEQAFSLLQNNMGSFQGNLRQSVLRLMALCCLSEDREEEARLYAEQLIKLNNFYNAVGDPARFQDLISQLKGGIAATITTASSQSETINEAPAPITIITAEMIEELGYNKTLNQILTAYVPGMTEITAMKETKNMAMHGAYAQGQELILIMENGHRLNTRFNNHGSTDYAISTEKIDHIEVLRGPASSLYGNVAVSAVVNIITKSGKSLNGVKAKYGYASYNTHRADFTMGTQFMDADIFGWASIYNSDGQKRHPDDGEGYMKVWFPDNVKLGFSEINYFYPKTMYIDGYKHVPAYDIGLTFRLKGFELLFSRKNAKKVQMMTPYNGGYDYDRFPYIEGIKPGYSTEETHAEISYSRTIKNIRLSGTLYSDWYNLSEYEADLDSMVEISPAYDLETYDYIYDENGEMVLDTIVDSGNFGFGHFREHTMGGYIRANTDYQIGRMKGNILAGIQFEHFSLLSRNYWYGNEFEDITNGHLLFKEVVDAGNEHSLSFFLQDKHYLLPQLIFNVGSRYDLKYRHHEDVVRTFSPRLALMYVPSDRFSLKLTYSEAFADLSFYFRYISKPSESEEGYDDYSMDPQHLSAVQLTAMGKVPSFHLNYELNFFYNKYSNLLCWQARDLNPDVENYDKNIGSLTNAGIEGVVGYAHKRLSTNLTFYYCHDIRSKHYYFNSTEKIVTAVPHLTFNLHAAYKLIQQTNHQLKVYGHSSYIGRKLNFDYVGEESDFFVDPKMLLDLGIQYCYKQRLQLSFDCENVFDTDHYICGPNQFNLPYIQRGRSLMASVSFQI